MKNDFEEKKGNNMKDWFDGNKNCLKVASTHEIIEKLMEYEKENGVGAVVGIASYCAGDRTKQYRLDIVNQSEHDRMFHPEEYRKTEIEISSVWDGDLLGKQ